MACLICTVALTDVLTVQGSRETSLYVLDCLFSVLIVGTLVVFVWIGAWTILDLFLYPQHADRSAWTSMVSTSLLGTRMTASVQRIKRKKKIDPDFPPVFFGGGTLSTVQ